MRYVFECYARILNIWDDMYWKRFLRYSYGEQYGKSKVFLNLWHYPISSFFDSDAASSSVFTEREANNVKRGMEQPALRSLFACQTGLSDPQIRLDHVNHFSMVKTTLLFDLTMTFLLLLFWLSCTFDFFSNVKIS